MASQLFQIAKQKLAEAGLNLATADLRVMLLMSNTTADSENSGVADLADFGTLDEFDGANYTAGGKALVSKSGALDTVNDRYELTADDLVWTALGVGTRDIVGRLIYVYVDGTAANDWPVAFAEYASPKTPDGSNFRLQWNDEGILQVANPS